MPAHSIYARQGKWGPLRAADRGGLGRFLASIGSWYPMLEKMMSERLRRQQTFENAIATMLHDVVALHGAEYGDVQLPLGDELLLVAQIGLTAPFLKTFMRVRSDDGCACGRALRDRKTVVIVDVECDPEYARFRADARAAGYRAVQSTPLFASDGELIGVVSTLFAHVHEPTAIEMQTLEKYSVNAADHLQKLLGRETLASKARAMNARLCAEFGLDDAAVEPAPSLLAKRATALRTDESSRE